MASAPLVRAGAPVDPAGVLPPLSEVASRAPAAPLTLAQFECSLSTVPLEELEGLARVLDHRWLAEGFARLRGTEEAALLATCLRRELLVLVRSGEDLERWRTSLPGRAEAWRLRLGREAVRHLFRVAAGRESLVVGEKEVRSQVRSAGSSTVSRHRRRALRDLVEGAANAADQIVPNVPASRSIAAVAATRVLELAGRPFPRVLVVGAGAVGQRVTELLSSSARLTVAYHQRPPDPEFLRATGARAVRAEGLAAEIALSDAVVTAARTGEHCLGAADLPGSRSVVLVDLGVPRNIDPSVRSLPNVRLVDLGELRTLSFPEGEPAVERALEESADRSFAQFETLALEPWVAAARRTAEVVRLSELGVAQGFLGALTPEQEAAVDRLTRRLVDRLLLGPTERLRAIPPGEDGDRLRRFALELLRPDPPSP